MSVRRVLVILAFVLAFAVGQVAFDQPVHAQATSCTTASLAGTDIFSYQGTAFGTAGTTSGLPTLAGDIRMLGPVTIQKSGQVTGSVTVTVAGGLPGSPSPTNLLQESCAMSVSGTFAVNSDCTGSAQITFSNPAGTNLTMPFALMASSGSASLLNSNNGTPVGVIFCPAPAANPDMNIYSIAGTAKVCPRDSSKAATGCGEGLNQ